MKPVVMHSPFHSLSAIMDDVFGGIGKDFSQAQTIPAINVRESADAYSVEVAAPGYEKEQFRVKQENHVLTISAAVEHNETDEKHLRREFSYRAFERKLRIPQSVDADKISASYQNGILAITLPKREELKPKPMQEIAIS